MQKQFMLTEERLKERIAGRNPRKQQMQTSKKYVEGIREKLYQTLENCDGVQIN